MNRNEKYFLGHWSRTSETLLNLGDALNEIVLPWISGRKVVHAGQPYDLRNPLRKIVCGIGSILDGAKFIERPLGGNVIVWGSGSKGLMKNAYHLRRSSILAVRGPLTRELLIDKGILDVPEVYGDPAMLMPEIWPRQEQQGSGDVVVIPHYKDRDNAMRLLSEKQLQRMGVKIIDVRGPPAEVVSKIRSAKCLVSSSLHGLILADAFGVPSTWVSFGHDLGGGDFKFRDHFFAVWGRARFCHIIDQPEGIMRAIEAAESPPAFDCGPLKRAFHF